MQINTAALDYTPVINALMQFAATVLLAVGVWAVQKWGASNAAAANMAQQSNYDTALKKSIAGAFDECESVIAKWGSAHPTVVPMLIDTAAGIMMKRFPQTAKAVGAKTPADLATGIRRVLATLPVVPPPLKGAVQ